MLRGVSIFKRFAHCVGCGNELVFPISRSKSFPSATNVPGRQVQYNQELNQVYTQLSDQQRQALNWENSASKSDVIEKHELQKEKSKSRATAAMNSNVCKKCVMSREGTIAPLNIPHFSMGFVGRIYHVIDALDFPLGAPSANNYGKGDIFVVNRCDLLVSHESQLRKLKRYFMDTVFNEMGIPEDHVVLTSAQRGWHLKKLSETFENKPKLNYFVGPTNSGKTSLVHALSEVPQKFGPTTWPMPFSTQSPLTYKSSSKFRARTLMDMPSIAQGSSALSLLLPSILRKVSAGTRMTQKDPKYTIPKISAKTGQVVSIGGIIALEFPPLERGRLPVHVFSGVGGLAHTDFGHAFKNMEKVNEINNSTDPSQIKLRMHDTVGLQLEKKLQFKPWLSDQRTRQSVVVKNIGYFQPFLFGAFPSDYEVTVWAPKGTEVCTRPEILPYL